MLFRSGPVAFIHLREQPRELEPVRFQIALPENVTLSGLAGFAVSPNGRQLVFTATDADGVTRLWLRALDVVDARPLPGTEGTTGAPPFWSPDSRFVAFNSAGKLKKIAIAGGPAQTLCDAPAVLGGSWNRAGVIVFAQVPPNIIMQVPAAGGVATPITKLEPSQQEILHAFPTFFPDGRHFLFLRGSVSNRLGAFVGSLDVKPEEQSSRLLVATPFGPAYVPSSDAGPGLLLFQREETLVAQPFDDRRLELSDEAMPVVERLGSFLAFPFFSASANGVLVYRTGADVSRTRSEERRVGKECRL